MLSLISLLIYFKRPPSPPLSQYVDENLFCDENTFRNRRDCSKEYCECVHRIKVCKKFLIRLRLFQILYFEITTLSVMIDLLDKVERYC